MKTTNSLPPPKKKCFTVNVVAEFDTLILGYFVSIKSPLDNIKEIHNTGSLQLGLLYKVHILYDTKSSSNICIISTVLQENKLPDAKLFYQILYM